MLDRPTFAVATQCAPDEFDRFPPQMHQELKGRRVAKGEPVWTGVGPLNLKYNY